MIIWKWSRDDIFYKYFEKKILKIGIVRVLANVLSKFVDILPRILLNIQNFFGQTLEILRKQFYLRGLSKN